MRVEQSIKRGINIVIVSLFVVGILSVQMVLAQGQVDWENQNVRATGIGGVNPNVPPSAQRAGALRAARQDALRNILETVKGMNLNSESTVENYMTTSDVIRSSVEGVVRGFKVVDQRYLSDGSVEVDVEMPITGVLSNALLTDDMFGGGQLMSGGLFCPTCGQPWPAGKPVPEGVTLIGGNTGTTPSASTTAAATAGGTFTGLIIDARGLGVVPAMAPKVLDEDNREVYGTGFVGREYAVQVGVIGYGKDLNQAKSNERVTNNPMVIKGMKATGANRADVVVSNADAARIHSAAQNMNFLDQCKVMILLD